MTLIDFKKIYEEEFLKLNAKQKEAVKTVEGPVMVIAGPGTGKTQILSRRVANILLNYDTNPEEIVCLTYTEAGASEMLDRLENLLGEHGRNVRVSTIHAFCSALILDNPDYFENQPKVISTAIKYELLKETMDENTKEGDILYKNSGDRYSSKEKLLDLFSRMKRQSLDKNDIKNEVDEYLKAIELSVQGDDLYKKFKYQRAVAKTNIMAGDLKPNFEVEKQKLKRMLNGSEIIEKYREKLADKNYFDFDDMILWTKELLENNHGLQQTISKGIKYLFVDEFQDTSVLQNELVDLLVLGKEKPNIFVVGDDDQSIYRFQGVSATNIEDFGIKYQPKEIVLEENYRSSQVIIDAAKQLISNNPRKDKQLIASGNNKYYAPKLPILTKYETDLDERIGVLNEVKELIDNGVTPADIGVIYGRNDEGKKLANLFRENGIPVNIKINESLFEDPFFKKLYALLKYVNKPYSTISDLRKILYFDFFNIPIEDLVAMRNIQEVKDVSFSKVIKFYKELEKLRKKLSNSKQYISPMYILQQIVKVLEIDVYIMKSKEKYHLVSVLTSLYEFMLNEMLIKPKLSLTVFLDCIAGLKEMKVYIPINELETSPDNCVNLMTAHGSKGLEFDYVFMVKCNDGKGKIATWPGSKSNNNSFSYPPSLNFKEENENELDEQEKRRLFYVAMTRAKKELNFSYSAKNPKTKFIAELGDYYIESNPNLKTSQNIKKSIIVPSLIKEEIKEIATNFSLSVSSLNSFLKCPLSFYFNKVLKHHSDGNEAMTFGSIVHEILEGIYVSDKNDSQELTLKSVISKIEAVQLFKEVFEQKSCDLPSDRARNDNYLRLLSIIENLYNANYFKPGILAIEKNIKNIKLGDIKNTTVDLSEVANFEINGKIDKIEVDGDIVRVIDYKTGNYEKSKKKLVGPNDDSPEGEDYWRQAVFYYILTTNSNIDLTGKKLVIQYVFVENENNPNGFSVTPDIEITEKDVDIVLDQIKAVLIKIKDGDYICGCGVFKKNENPNNVDVYPCDYCAKVTLNSEQLLDNRQAIEVASYKQAIKSFKSLSVSVLNRFLDCSNSFYFDNVLQLTTVAGLKLASKEYASKVEVKHAPTGPVFGTVMHETMESIYKKNLNLDEALAVFDKSLSTHEVNIIDTMDVKDMKVYGYKLLENLFESYIPNSCKNVQLEKEIYVTLENNLPINGIIDKLEFDGDIIRVVDYKTGSAQHGIEELEVGRNYWRQAVYYNILLEENPEIVTSGKTIETRYIFLDDDTQESGYSIHDVIVTDEDIATVKQQIQEFWTSIRTGKYSCSCEKDDCDFCRLSEFVNLESFA